MTKYMFALSMLLSAGAMHAAAGELNKKSVAIAIQSTVTQSDKQPEKNIAAPAAPSLAEIAEKTTPAAPMTPEENECFYYDGIPSPYKHNQRSPYQFKRCMDFKKSEKELAKAIESAKPSWKNLFFSRCVASYTIESGEINTISHSQIPCDQALEHIFSGKKSSWIEGLNIRMTNPVFTSFSIPSTQLNQAATMHVAVELLSKITHS